MDMNGLATYLSAKYLLRALPSIPMSRCASGILIPVSTVQVLEEGLIMRVAREVEFMFRAGGVIIDLCLVSC